ARRLRRTPPRRARPKRTTNGSIDASEFSLPAARMRIAPAALLSLLASGAARASAQGLPEAAGASPAFAECPLPGPLTASFDGAMVHVRYLADPALAGREVGSTGERCAADYLAGRFQEL